jgi:putative ABC transport system substrate-binding protein
MKRREFIGLLGGAAATWPLAGRAQQRERVRRLGILMGGIADGAGGLRLDAFLQALEQAGWKQGHNIAIDLRWGANDPERVAAVARELVALMPEVFSPVQAMR